MAIELTAKASNSDVQAQGGAGLLQTFFNNSLSKALVTLYPGILISLGTLTCSEHDWQPWKFEKLPKGSCDNGETGIAKVMCKSLTDFEWKDLYNMLPIN